MCNTQKGETDVNLLHLMYLQKFNNNYFKATNDDFLKNNQPKLFFLN